MSNASAALRKLMDAVDSDSDVDFVADAHTLLALAISRLEPRKRVNALEDIGWTLRQEIALILGASPGPQVPEVNRGPLH